MRITNRARSAQNRLNNSHKENSGYKLEFTYDSIKNQRSKSPARAKRMQAADLEKFEQKNFEQLLNKITYQNPKYTYDRLFGPSLPFYKFLAVKQDLNNQTQELSRLQIWIPDTIVFNDSFTPQWIYSSTKGYVYRTDSFNDLQIIKQIGNRFNYEELVAVVKRPSGYGFNTQIFNTIDMRKQLSELSSRGPVVLQKFVKSNGPMAFVARTEWHQDGRSLVWVITNKAKFFDEKVDPKLRCVTQTRTRGACTIISSKTGQYLSQTLPYVERIVKFIENNIRCKFSEITCDFIKDENGRWWFVGCKSFLLQSDQDTIYHKFCDDAPPPLRSYNNDTLKQVEYQRLKRCRLCQIALPFSELTHQLTIKMITETDQHLRLRGIAIQWLDRAEYRHIDMATLYQSYPVCKNCYKLYELTEELKELVRQFSNAVGVPAKINNNDEIKPGVEMPDDWMLTLPPASNAVTVVNDQPAIAEMIEINNKPLTLYRMIIVIKEWREVPALFSQFKSIVLKFQIFNIKHKYKIKSNTFLNKQLDFVPINKVRLLHVYAKNRDKIKQFLQEFNRLELKLYCDKQFIGEARCEIGNLHDPLVVHRQYYQLISGKFPHMGYIKCDLGMEEGPLKDVSMLKLKAFRGVFVPPEDYIHCQPLPDEWLDILPDLKVYYKKLKDDYQIEPISQRLNISVETPISTSNILRSRPQSTKGRSYIRSSSARHNKAPRRRVHKKYRRKVADISLAIVNQDISLNNSITRSFHQQLPKRVWAITINFEKIVNMRLQQDNKATILFEISDIKYAGQEVQKDNSTVLFNFEKVVYLQGRLNNFKQFLQENELKIAVLIEDEVGKVQYSIKELIFEEKLQKILSIPFESFPQAQLLLSIQRQNFTDQLSLVKIKSLADNVDLMELK